jgi:hypothetical protein
MTGTAAESVGMGSVENVHGFLACLCSDTHINCAQFDFEQFTFP